MNTLRGFKMKKWERAKTKLLNASPIAATVALLAVITGLPGSNALAVLTGDTVLRERVYEGPSIGNRRLKQLTATGIRQAIRTDWQDVGAEIPVDGAGVLGVFGRVTNQSSRLVRFRFLHKLSTGATDKYILNRPNPVSGIVANYSAIDSIVPNYTELTDTTSGGEINTLFFFTYRAGNLTPYVQLQVSSSSEGATPGHISSVYVSEGFL